MKLFSALQWIYKFFSVGKRVENMRLLQQQRFLLHQGIEATAEVMETLLFDEKVGSMLPVRLWVKLKKADGTYIYTHTNTLVTLNHIPGKGQTVRIKYIPDNLSAILIL